MNKKKRVLIIIISVLIILLVLLGLYHMLNKRDKIENYLPKNTILFAYKTNSGKSGKVVESLISEITSGGSKDKLEGVNLSNKYITSAFFELQGGSGGPFTIPGVIIGIHPVFYPIIQMFMLSHYATSAGNGFYILKPNMQTELVNALSSNAYIQNLVRNGKVYIKPYKGYLLMGLSQADMNSYIGQLDSKQYNEGMQSEVKKLSKQSSLFIVANVVDTISKTPLALFMVPNPDLNYIAMYTHYTKSNSSVGINWDFIGQNGIFEGNKMPTSGASLANYSGNMNSIYMSSSNLTAVTSMMNMIAGKWISAQTDNPLLTQLNQVLKYQSSNGNNSVIGSDVLIGVTSQGSVYTAFTAQKGVNGDDVTRVLPQLFGAGRPFVQNQGDVYFINALSTNIKIGEFYNKNAFINGIARYKGMTFTLLGTSDGNTLHVALSTNSQALAKSLKK